MSHTPLQKGQRPRIKKIDVLPWDTDGNFTVNVKVDKVPKLSESKKCYMFAFQQGETPIEVEIGGVPRKVRMTFMLYVKIPATERRKCLEEEAKQAEALGEPRLY